MYEFIFYFFAILTFFILIRESIIDIQTMYVPDNITFSLYTSSVVFLISSWFVTHSFQPILDGFFGFLLGFGVPFAISLLSYLIQKAAYKTRKKKERIIAKDSPASVDSTEQQDYTIRETQNNTIEPANSTSASSKNWKIKRIIYWVCCFGFLSLISFQQSYISPLFFLGIGSVVLLVIVGFYEKTHKIELPIYLFTVGMILLALVIKQNKVLIYLTVGAIVAEFILAKIFRRFYKIELEEPEETSDEEDNIEGGIGGGDILIFGALGLLFGIKGVITILIYAVFCQLFVIFSYLLLSKEQSPLGHVPFVPGITIGLYFYIMGFDLFHIQQVLSFFWGVAA